MTGPRILALDLSTPSGMVEQVAPALLVTARGLGQHLNGGADMAHDTARKAPRSTDPRARREYRVCATCGEEFFVRPSDDAKNARRGHGPRRFCSQKCQSESYRGAGNPKWRGGQFENGQGYTYRYCPDHPFATKDGYVMEHRLVMEAVVGRYLTPEEQVHHRNGLKSDNRPENLELMPSVVEHRKAHADYQPDTCANCGAALERSIAHRRNHGRAVCSLKCGAAYASKCAAERSQDENSGY